MRAVVLDESGGPDNLRVRDVPQPVPSPNEVLVRVRACGVDAHDTAVRSGLLKGEFQPGMVLGHEIAGDVIAVGDIVRVFAPGDRVCCKQTTTCGLCKYCRTGHETMCPRARFNRGGLAEYVALPQDAWVKIPDGVTYPAAAVLSCAVGTVYHAIREVARVVRGERLLVTGAGGGLGMHAVQIAKYYGAEVFALTSSPAKRDAIVRAGADHVFLVDAVELLHVRIAELTGGEGIDVVIDTVGAPIFGAAFRSVAVLGRYVVVGQLLPEKVAFHPAHLFSRELSILGANGTRRHELEQLLDLVRDGLVTPVISRTAALSEVTEVHRAIESGRVLGRIVIDPNLGSASTGIS